MTEPPDGRDSDPAAIVPDRELALPDIELRRRVTELLEVSPVEADWLIAEAERLYTERMRSRFTDLRTSERIKRTNPFLLRIRGARTVRDWASLQVQGALYASEEEAVGHLLEMIAKTCFPGSRDPTFTEDLDFEAERDDDTVLGFQIKLGWDAMPMSSRKNLSNTMRRLTAEYSRRGTTFVGYFAPTYGRARTSKPPGQDYIVLASREFWLKVGGGKPDFDVRVGEVCALLCAEARVEVLEGLVPVLIDRLAEDAAVRIGDPDGSLNYARLFRQVNK